MSDDAQNPRLGELLVAAGALTHEALLEVLARHQGSDVPLGRLLVEGGYVSAPAVAMALANQRGGLARTEYGFATGYADLPPVVPIDPPWVEGGLALVSEEAAATEPRSQELIALSEMLELERTTSSSLAEEVTRLEAEIAVQRDAAAGASAEELEQAGREVADLRAAVERERARAAEQSQELDTLRAEREQATRELAELRAAVERERAAAAERADEVARLEAQVAEAAAPVHAQDAHALFVHSSSGYRYLERAGAPPASGTQVAIDDVTYDVIRVGPGPFPGSAVACAYVERAR